MADLKVFDEVDCSDDDNARVALIDAVRENVEEVFGGLEDLEDDAAKAIIEHIKSNYAEGEWRAYATKAVLLSASDDEGAPSHELIDEALEGELSDY